MMMAKDILMITVLVKMRRTSNGFLFPRWNCRSGNLGFSPPVDGDGGADGKIGNNHYARVEEDKGLRCDLRVEVCDETHDASDSIGHPCRCRHVVTRTLVSDCLYLSAL